MQATLPNRLILGNRWLLPGVGVALLVAVVAANPRRMEKTSTFARVAALALAATISLANAGSAARLIVGLVEGTEPGDASQLLITGGTIWFTNVIAFALWYFEFDRGGPAKRAWGTHQYPDFLFPQMGSPDMAPRHWEPRFVDYFYMSFTNATAFSPTDVMPLSRWTKLTMLAQSAVSLMTVALVVARAVNILK